jgi:Uma2 family endonuclease
MATVPQQRRTREIDYPTGDGKPMAETELHINDMMDLIQTLGDYFEREPMVYVGGNMLVFYEEGNRRKHVAPDVFVVRGVEKKKNVRGNYLIWKENRPLELVIELTSKSTRNEDKKTKWALYRDTIRVSEYFLFDPTEDYLKPSLQGFRLIAGDYVPIEPVDGRLPSQVLGLHLERDGKELRLYNPATGARLLKKDEQTQQAQRIADEQRQRAEEEHQRAEEERQRAEEERQRAEEERQRAEEERQRAEAAEAVQQRLAEENERLRLELEALRRGLKLE